MPASRSQLTWVFASSGSGVVAFLLWLACGAFLGWAVWYWARNPTSRHPTMRTAPPYPRFGRAAASVIVLSFAAAAYATAWSRFYVLTADRAGVRLAFHAPSREVVLGWRDLAGIEVGPGVRGRNPLYLRTRNGGLYESMPADVGEVRRLRDRLNQLRRRR